MALTKVTYGLLSADTSAIDLNIDANTLYVDSSANTVGIGTTSPSTKFDVVGSILSRGVNNASVRVDSISNAYMIIDRSAANRRSALVFSTAATNVLANPPATATIDWALGVSDSDELSGDKFCIASANTNFSAAEFVIDSSGNVGIGTTSPDRQLEVEGQGVIRLNADGTSGQVDPGIDFNTAGTNDMQFRYRAASDKLAVYSYGTSSDVLTIKKSDGYVGIGTTSPLDLLHLNSTSGDVRQLMNAPTDSDAEIKFAENGTVKFTIGNDAATDSFVIGTTNVDTGKRFEINSSGVIKFNGAYTFPTSDGSANQVLQTNGSGALSFGTISTSDSTKLPLSGGTLTGNLQVKLGNSGQSAADSSADELVVENSGNSGLSILSGASNYGTILFGDSGDSAAGRFRYEHDNNALNFGTNGSWNRMYINSSGNVGIGTTSPSSKLTIDGSSGAYIRINNAASGDVSSGFQIYNGSNLDTQIYTNPTFGNTTFLSREALAIRTGGAERMRIASNGRVGIGTTGGNAGLHVANGDIRTTSAAFANDANSLSMSWESSGIGYLTARGPSTSERGKLGLSVNRSNGAAGITGLLIDNDGAVLINTTVNAESQAMRIRQGGSNANAALSLDSDTGDQSYYRYMRFYRKGQTSSVAKLDIDWSGSSIGLSFTSDARLKTVTGEADGLELITRLNPVKYVWKSEPDREGAQGFLAQEVEQAYYETGNSHARGVSRPIDGEKWYMLDDTTLIPNLVKAIKELKEENDALKARVEALES